MASVTNQIDFSAPRLVILGGGPGGYEAAMVANSLGAKVTVIERKGMGGSAVLTDVVPSKTLIATADAMRRVVGAHEGVRLPIGPGTADFLKKFLAAFADHIRYHQRARSVS